MKGKSQLKSKSGTKKMKMACITKPKPPGMQSTHFVKPEDLKCMFKFTNYCY